MTRRQQQQLKPGAVADHLASLRSLYQPTREPARPPLPAEEPPPQDDSAQERED